FMLAGQTQDNVRVFIFWDGEKVEMTPKRGKEGLVQFIAILERKGILGEKGKVDIRKHRKLRETPSELVLATMRQQLSRRKEVVYLGDMLRFPKSDEARKLTADPHFRAIRLLSPLDLNP